ncbi:hypothetical protein BDW62DRAFT_206741 [Aspergillus aurantiobrunneus]
MDNNTSTPTPKSDSTVELQVGERRFTTPRETRTRRSAFFKCILSSRWNEARADGSYFIDANPGLFEDILSYLRRPSALPIFYTSEKGHDHARYEALLEEAKYFWSLRADRVAGEARIYQHREG